ncbi:MAG: hypothetical protein IT427_03295 [Pirellulales bacterium]|nr:hypothetical protein [Pirellulales bacterium]
MDNTNLMPGKIGNALQFLGGDEDLVRVRVEVAEDDPDFDRSYTEFTFAAWLQPNANGWIAGKMGFSGNRGWQFQYIGADLYLSYFDGPSGAEHEVFLGSDPFLAAPGEFVHTAFVFKANEYVKFYINGTPALTDTGALSAFNGSNDSALQVGNRGNSNPNSFNGLIDDVYIFDEALSDSQIAAIAAGSQAVPGDFNGDGNVDGADFVAWQTHFPTASGASLADGDANGDEAVDGADFVIWQTNFPFPLAPGVSPVPEPPAILLATVMWLIAAIARYRRHES